MAMAAALEIRVADLPEVRAALKQAERRIKEGDALASEVRIFLEGVSGRGELADALERYLRERAKD